MDMVQTTEEPEIIENETEPIEPTIVPKKGAQAYLQEKERQEKVAQVNKHECPIQTNRNVFCTNGNSRNTLCKRIRF